MRVAPVLALLLLAGCLAEEPAPTAPTPREEGETSDAGLRALEETFTGSVSGTPVAPGVQEFTLDVPTGAIGVNGTLSWTTPTARLALQLVDPDGEVVATGRDNGDMTMTVVTEDAEPPSGTWTFRVSTTLPAPTEFSLVAVAELLVPRDNAVVKTVEVGTFYEINLIMEANATFTIGFNASQTVKWDVHSHPGGEVKYWHEGEGTTGSYAFTAPERGIYSVLFENANPALRAQVSFELLGAFRIHSHAQ